MLKRYAMERLLYRLSRTTHAERFVLKGAMLFPGFLSRNPLRGFGIIGYLGNGAIANLLNRLIDYGKRIFFFVPSTRVFFTASQGPEGSPRRASIVHQVGDLGLSHFLGIHVYLPR